MSRLLPTTSLNDAIRRVADGNTGAASVVAMLNRESPQNIMEYLRVLDGRGLYGISVYDAFWAKCNGNVESFIRFLTE